MLYFFVFAQFSCRLVRWKTTLVYRGMYLEKFPLLHLVVGGWWLVFGQLLWIHARGGRTFLQQPRLLYPSGDWIGGIIKRKKSVHLLHPMRNRLCRWNARAKARELHLCLARRRLPHWMHPPLPPECHLLFLWLQLWTWGAHWGSFEDQGSPPTYNFIQEFLNKVCVAFFCFLQSFNGIQYLFIILYILVVWAILDQMPNQRFT
jgi:hypothetical protein